MIFFILFFNIHDYLVEIKVSLIIFVNILHVLAYKFVRVILLKISMTLILSNNRLLVLFFISKNRKLGLICFYLSLIPLCFSPITYILLYIFKGSNSMFNRDQFNTLEFSRKKKMYVKKIYTMIFCICNPLCVDYFFHFERT